MTSFTVIDNTTGNYPDCEKIALEEDWAKGLIYCDIDTFAITEDGNLILMDDCGNSAYCPADRFTIVFESAIISALEKQIPKKPIKQIWIDDEKHKGDVRLATKDDVLTKDNHGIINLCPNCKEWVMRYKYLRPPNDKDYYCKHCGQALDWSDTE